MDTPSNRTLAVVVAHLYVECFGPELTDRIIRCDHLVPHRELPAPADDRVRITSPQTDHARRWPTPGSST